MKIAIYIQIYRHILETACRSRAYRRGGKVHGSMKVVRNFFDRYNFGQECLFEIEYN